MHLEVTSRCILHCPGCPRTSVVDRLGSFPKQDLDLNDFKKLLDCESGKNLTHLHLEGNHGDPIYYPHLFELIDQHRDKNFNIVTNGSRRDQQWWSELAARLTKDDWVIFSIDGLEHNNHIYRKNSDWASTMTGIETIAKSPAKLGWKTIIFSYNYNEIDQIKLFAESKGAKFFSQTTNRFGDESLRPPTQLIDRTREYRSNSETPIELDPQCVDHNKEYISADGYYWPCCWVTSAFTLYKSDLWKNRSHWAIKNKSLDQMRDQLNNWIKQLKNQGDSVDSVCKMMCKKGNEPWPLEQWVSQNKG